MNTSLQSPVRRPAARRPGTAIVLVLGLLALAFALAYSMTRSQFTFLQIQQNNTRRAESRNAAYAGMSVALRNMHLSSWQGIGSSLAGNLAVGQSYVVTFAAGDPFLQSGDAEFSRYPYRVTVTASGYAADYDRPSVPANHVVTAVVELVPRKLSTEPAGWSAREGCTLYQSYVFSGKGFAIEPGFRAEGKVRCQYVVDLCDASPAHSDARARWLGDLNQSRLAGGPDERPFSGMMVMPFRLTELNTYDQLTNLLGLTLEYQEANAVLAPGYPATVSNYRLYPGGPLYTVPWIDPPLKDTVLDADPLTNPLGLFFYSGQLDLESNLSLHGTLINGSASGGELRVKGTNIEIFPIDLPPLDGTTAPIQLPAIIQSGSLSIEKSAGATFAGLVAVAAECRVRSAPQDAAAVLLTGQLLCRELNVTRRNEWNHDAGWWQARLDEFSAQLDDAAAVPFFPDWLEQFAGLSSSPRVTVRPSSSPVRYHWQDWSQPVFVRHDDDVGLRWNICRWQDNP